MSIMFCDECSLRWDSDFHEVCPRGCVAASLSRKHLDTLSKLERAKGAGFYTFRQNSSYKKLDRLGCVTWRNSRGSSENVGRFYLTEVGRAALTHSA